MASTWTLTATTADGPRMISGQAADADVAEARAWRVARDVIGVALQHTHYEMHIDGQLLAIIDTGLAVDGTPDRGQALALLDRIGERSTLDLPDIAVPRYTLGGS